MIEIGAVALLVAVVVIEEIKFQKWFKQMKYDRWLLWKYYGM